MNCNSDSKINAKEELNKVVEDSSIIVLKEKLGKKGTQELIDDILDELLYLKKL